ncbi:putative protein PhnB [Acetobacteraceae bacterium AT-5844]|nr:putative protein PhnB [Acetobacteraceae bacterium AT-5844]
MSFIPYLYFNGTCREAFAFYEKVVGAKTLAMMPHTGTPAEEQVPPEWREKIIHACMEVNGQRLMAGDVPPGQGSTEMQGFSVLMEYPTVEEATRVFNGLSEGGTIRMPIAPTFWAKAFGMLVDRYGVPWMISGPYAEDC